MNDRVDAFIERKRARNGAAAPSPVDAFVERKRKRLAAEAVTELQSLPFTVQDATDAVALATDAGIGIGRALAAPNVERGILAARRAAQALEGAPKLADWLRADPINGALAQDDLDGLSWWERGLDGLFSVPGTRGSETQVGKGLRTGVLGAGQMGVAAATVPVAGAQARLLDRLAAFEKARTLDPASPRHEIAAALGIDPMSPEAGLVADFVRGDAARRQLHVDRTLKMVTSNKELMGALVAKVKEYDERLKATQGRVANFTDIDDVSGFFDWLGFNVGQAAPYLAATLAAGAVAGPAGVAASGYGMGVGDIRAEQITDGQDPFDTRAAGAAVAGGVPYAALELLGPAAAPFRGVGGETLGRVAQGFFRRLGREVPKNFVEEFINEAGQEIVKDYAVEAGGGDQVTLDDDTLLRWFNAGMAGAASGGAMSAGQVALSAAAEKQAAQAARAGETAAALDQASAMAQASKVRERSPDRFQAALDAVGQGDRLIYVPAAEMREYFQDQGLPIDAETLGVDAATVDEMAATGGRVGIPMSHFAARIAGTDAEAWVRDNATMDPDEMSAAEARAFNEAVADDMAQAHALELQAQQDAEASRTDDAQVYDGIYSQLRGAGRTVDVAQREAQVWTAFMRTMAGRVGESALDLSRRLGVTVRGPQEAAVGRKRGPIDVLLNDLRAGRKEKTGLSLTEWVVAEGGVQDRGGDVAAIEGPKGLVGESAGQIAAREGQPTMPGMMPATGRGTPLDELGRRAVEAGYFPELAGETAGLNEGETAGLNEGEAADLGRALLDALRDEAGGNRRYRPGDGPTPARAELEAELSRRGLDPASMTNDEIVGALEGAQGAEYGQDAVPDGAERQWLHGLERAEKGLAKPLDSLSMGRPGPILRRLGLSKAPLTMSAGKLDKVMKDHPEVSLGVLRHLVKGLNDPEFVLTSATEQGSIVVIPVRLPNGQVFVVPIHPDVEDRQGRKVNLIASAYIKTDADWFDQQVKAGRLVYARDGKSAAVRANVAGSDSRHGQPNPTGRNAPRVKNILSRDDIIKPPAAPEGGTEFSQGAATRRGSIVFPVEGLGTGETIINLFETADLSTFLHESGHFFLEAMDRLAADPSAPQDVRDDMAQVREWLGAKDGAALTRDQHEQFARGFEAYVMEGKAPSLALADAFGRMKAWLLRIYRSALGLNVTVTDDIRAVFDRMLATEAEITQARAEASANPLFGDRPQGMSDADWRTYQRLAQRAQEAGEARLRERTMERIRREKEAWWKAERAEVRKGVEAQKNAQPRHRLVEAMANGRWLEGGEVTEAPDLRIDRKLLIEQFGQGILTEVSRNRLGGKRAIYADAGLSPEAAARMFGFDGAPAMIEALQNTGRRVAEIEAETDRVMLDRYGDPFTDGSIEQEALDAIHNDQQQLKNVVEARQIATRMGRSTAGMTRRSYRKRAANILARLPVRDATRSGQFLAAERRAGRLAQEAFAKVVRGDAGALAQALQAKEQQVLNAALYDLSREATADVEAFREKARGYTKASVREKLDGGYIEQIDALLERFDFRRRAPGQIARAEALRAFVDRMVAEGRDGDLAIDARLLDEARRVHYSRMTLDEFRGLRDTVDNIDHLGRFKQRLIDRKRQREFAASKGRIIAQVVQRGRDAMSSPRGKSAQALRELLNLSKTADTIIVELDGLQETGDVFDELRRDVFEGEVAESQMRIAMQEQVSALIGAHYTRAQIADMGKERHVAGANGRLWSKSQILSVAMNTGNEGNFQRLIDDRVPVASRLTPEQVQALLATLDDNDWRFVQGMWDQIGGYTDQLAAVHKRRKGVEMKRVESQMMVGAPAFVRGGYYPISYDPTKSSRAAEDTAGMFDRMMRAGRGGAAQVEDGMTNERQATGGGRPLRLDLGVAVEGMRSSIRVIALSEAVDNSARLLRDKEVRQTFIERGLDHEWKMLDLMLQDVASGPVFHDNIFEKGARILKNNVSAMFLGANIKTAILQVTGAAQSAAVIGKRNLARGYLAYARNPVELVTRIKAVSPFMAERHRTFNKDFADMMADPARTDPIRGRVTQGVDKVKEAAYAPITLMQFYTVDVPTWAGAYQAKIDEGASDADAAAYADLMVDRAQGSGLMGSRSAMARGTVSANMRQAALFRLFTTLGGYMITKLNRGVIAAQRGAKAMREADTPAGKIEAAASAAMNLTLLYVVEGALMGLMWSLMDDDDEPGDLLKFTLKETGMAMVGGLPFVRDMVGFASEGFGAGGMVETIGAIPGRIWRQALQGENDRAFRKAVADGVGAVTGLPTTATLRAIEGAVGEDDMTWAEMFLGKNPLTR